MPPLDAAQAAKIEEIFFPYATKQRRDCMARNIAKRGKSAALRFVHYTSVKAALSIISSKRVWARNTAAMIDHMEIRHGFELLQRSLHAGSGRVNRFAEALNACHAGSADKVFDYYNKTTGVIVNDTYVACLSEHDGEDDFSGRLSMWRGFARAATDVRVAIVLDVPWSSPGAVALGMIFSPVAYLKNDEMERVIEEVIGNLHANREFLQQMNQNSFELTAYAALQCAGTCVKHPGFKEEREWRAVLPTYLRQEKLLEPETVDIGGVSQKIYKIPLDGSVSAKLADLDFARMFQYLIIGPATTGVDAISKQFVERLTKVGVAEAGKRIHVSDIPLRPGW